MKKLFKSTPFLAIVTCILWGSSFVPTKIGLEYMQAPLQFAGYTFLLSGLLLAPWTKNCNHFFQQIRQHFWLMVKVGFFSTTLLYGAFYMGQNLADASIVSLIVGCQPFFVALLAHFILKNEKFTPLKSFSLVLSIIGLIIVSWPSFSHIPSFKISSALGIIFILIDCMSAAYGNIIVSQIDFKKVDIKVLNSTELIFGGCMLLMLAYPLEGFAPLPSNGKFYLSLACMIFITIIAMVIWFSLLARPETKVSELNMWKFLMPVVGSLESWILLKNDVPTVYSVTGLLIITISLIIFNYKSISAFLKR